MSANTLSAEFPGEVHLKIDDAWLNGYSTTDQYVDCRDLDSTSGGRRMRPRAIQIGFNSSDATATTATVCGVLWGENHAQADTYILALGVVHPIAFKFIYARDTNARRIKILG